MLAMTEYCMKDYQTASDYFKKYYQTYPKGRFSEMAEYYIGQSLYESTPVPQLDQTETLAAITAFQEYLDLYPEAKMKTQAQNQLFKLQEKLVSKELYSAQLYYDLGTYFGNCTSGGNNYEACVITAQNALNEYPYSDKREDFSKLIFKAKYELAKMSIPTKQMERYQEAEDECYGFVNEFPDSKERETAEKYIENCKEWVNTHEKATAMN
jgi:outer membrane protein assembly factor BamD